MVAWGNSKAVGMAFGNSKAVGGAWGNQKFAFRTVFEWSGAARRSGNFFYAPLNSATRLPAEWIVGGAAAYLVGGLVSGGRPTASWPRMLGNIGRVELFLSTRPNAFTNVAGPEFTTEIKSSLRMEFIHATAGTLVLNGIGDSTEPYAWTPTNSAQVITWVNAVRNNDNVRMRFIV